MGRIMSGCGAHLGAHVCNGSSGSAPSWSPWRFSIRPRTFAEVAWGREILCAGASAEIARWREELRTGSPDAVGRHASEPNQKWFVRGQSIVGFQLAM